MIKKYILSILLVTTSLVRSHAQQAKKMEWFADAKLGIFIHWGIYSVKGIPESWSFFNNYLSHEAYMSQLAEFTAAQYDPEEWVDLIAESGAQYAVIASKHHDGVALWDSQIENAITIKQHGAAQRDVLSPFVSSLQAKGLKTGLYFSLPDWSNPDYDVFTRTRIRYKLKEEPKRWTHYQHYLFGQLNELTTRYHPDLLWFDGDWEHSSDEWQADKIKANLRNQNAHIIVNSRLTGHGDYATPEQGIPVLRPASTYWELCYTLNDSWGYQPYDQHYKSANMIIRTLIDCISMGGNLLLDIAPRADGTIPSEQATILKALGRWTKKNQQAIYGTREGLPFGYFSGKSTLSKDKKTIYLFLENRDNKTIHINGLQSKIEQISVLGYGADISFKETSDQLLIDIPKAAEDPDATVVAIQLTAPLTLKPLQARPITYESLNQSNSRLNTSIEAIIQSINQNSNPFINSNLSTDGYDFTLAKNPQLTAWIKKHAEALHHTGKGLPYGHYNGLSVLSEDKQTLYLCIQGIPTGPIAIKGLKNQIQRARIVGEGTLLTPEVYNKLYWSKVPGITYIPVPEDRLDSQMTIIALLLDGPLALYRENVGAIESNL